MIVSPETAWVSAASIDDFADASLKPSLVSSPFLVTYIVFPAGVSVVVIPLKVDPSP